MPNPPGANPLVAERASWRSSQSCGAGVSSLSEIPTDSCHFFCTPGNPCATPIVTRGEGSFSYQGVSTRGVRHSPVGFPHESAKISRRNCRSEAPRNWAPLPAEWILRHLVHYVHGFGGDFVMDFAGVILSSLQRDGGPREIDCKFTQTSMAKSTLSE